MKLDFKQISQDSLANAIQILSDWLPDGKVDHGEFISLNPKRPDNKLGSFKINLTTGQWSDFAETDINAKGPDLIRLYGYLNDVDDYASAKEIKEKYLFGFDSKNVPLPKKKPTKFDIIEVAPREPKKTELYFPKMGELSNYSTYRNTKGDIIGVVARFIKDGNKSDMPYRWGKNKQTGVEKYFCKGWSKTEKPIYNIENFNPELFTLIVEGEKCVNAIKDIVSKKINVVSWQSGSKSVDRADWSFLKDSKVIIWPDNDEPGFKVRDFLIKKLSEQNNKVIVVPINKNWPKTYDCADFIEENTPKELFKIILSAKKYVIEKEEIPLPEYMDYQDSNDDLPINENQNNEDDDEPDHSQDASKEFQPDNHFFRLLGHNRDGFYFLPKAKGQIIKLASSSLSGSNLLSLAPKEMWSSWFPSKNGVSWMNAADRLIRLSYKQGIFTPDNIRGRGAWHDNDNIIVHKGEVMMVNNKPCDPVDYQGEYIYERGAKILSSTDAMATKEQGKELIELCKLFNWKSPIHALYASGWAYLSPICSILPWRPHLWMTGEAGCGKSFFTNNVLKHFIAGFGILTKGSTTEASLRQTLLKDGVSVLFDEAGDNEDISGQKRLQGVIELMRQASMPGEAVTLKGSASGEASSFIVNSMFALVAINPSIRQQADQGRISIIELLNKYDNKKEYYDKCNSAIAHLFKKNTTQEFRNRAFNRIPQILKNIEIFREVCSDYFNNQRTGDQLGTLLAGAFCLGSDGVASYNVAMEWIKKQDWTEQENLDIEKDQDAILRLILQTKQKVHFYENSLGETSIEKLIYTTLNGNLNSGIIRDEFNASQAREVLENIGINISKNYKNNFFMIDARNKYMDELLRDTAYSGGYHKILERCDGAIKTKINYTNQAGKRTTKNAIKFNADFIVKNYDSREEVEDDENEFFDGSIEEEF